MTTSWRRPMGKRAQAVLDRIREHGQFMAMPSIVEAFKAPYRPPLSMRTGCVYFIEAVGCDRIKIGFTRKEIDFRLKFIQTGCPFPARVLRLQRGSMQDERDLHGRFAHALVRDTGEWFHATPDLLAYIENEFP